VAGRILAIEPQCIGFAHAAFNAALIHALLHAFPGESLHFQGEAEHIAWVRRSLSAQVDRDTAARVSWEPIAVPARTAGAARVLLQEAGWTRRLARDLRRPDVAGAVVCSVTNTSLFALKPLLAAARIRKPVLAVVHAVLATLLEPGRSPLRRIVHLRVGLSLPHPRCLRFLSLSDGIQSELNKACPRFASVFTPIDAPYAFDHRPPTLPDPGQPVRFGYFGVSNHGKGFDRFLTLARVFKEADLPAGFVHVGFVLNPDQLDAVREVLPDATSEPLSEEAFAERARSVTYAVWTCEPDHYRLTCSASFLDALAYAKPGLYLRNPYIAHYAEQMGDIGYLCDNMDALQERALELAQRLPVERYQAQQAAILAGRARFAPEQVALRLRAAWDHLHGELQPNR